MGAGIPFPGALWLCPDAGPMSSRFPSCQGFQAQGEAEQGIDCIEDETVGENCPIHHSGFQGMVPGPAAPALPGKIIEMHESQAPPYTH